MRYSLFAASFALVSATGCVNEASAPGPVPIYRLTAIVTENNECTVSVLNKTYSSIGQVRGDVPTKFIGTVKDKSYHGFGCWVKTADGDGDLVILFSRNAFQKPLDVGTYPLNLEILDETPAMTASVTFRPSSLGGDNLRTMDGASGNVVVDSTATGARRIRADVDVVRWTRSAF